MATRIRGTVVMWHTPDDKYASLAHDRCAELIGLDQPFLLYTFTPRPCEGFGKLVARVKTNIWRQAMAEAPGPILLMDVDCRIKGSLDPLFSQMQGCDIGFSIFKKKVKSAPYPSTRVLYLSQSDRARACLTKWQEITAGAENEESTLMDALARTDSAAAFGLIPPAYAGHGEHRAPDGAIITHVSANRENGPAWKRAEQYARRVYRSAFRRAA